MSRSSSPLGGIPPIRGFQFDGSSIGELASEVNLFRCDANLTRKLVSLPGRNPQSGLDLDLTILYQSNVFRNADRWNRDSPTGVLGLGWDLPLSYIEAEESPSPDPNARNYTLYANGTPNSMVRQNAAPVLFNIDAEVVSSLAEGPISAALRSAFCGVGLAVDPSAVVAGQSPSWQISDALNQQVFSVSTSSGGGAAVAYGGQSFQLVSYRFWFIHYFPQFERWLIVSDKGLRKSFGGIGPKTAQGNFTSAGNSVRWDVWWAPAGVPAWRGPSLLASGQVQVASAWYLSSHSDQWGDAVSFSYNEFPRDPSTGLIPNAEQRVGTGGLAYTKAVYLTGVRDVFGRTVSLSYSDKLWDNSSPEAPREYADPHRAQPSNNPSPYQDRYETKYLAGLTTNGTSGELLFSIEFVYDPNPTVNGPDRAVANVTSFSGSLQGDTYKRYLTSVVMLNQDGRGMPGYSFSYYLEAAASGSQPGALQSVISPQGGKATYTYSQSSLSVCDRLCTVTPPSQLGPDASPRVFYGDENVVNTWYDNSSNQLTLQVFTWQGRWIAWTPSWGTTLDTGGVAPSSLNVIASSDFFVVTFDRVADSCAYVFQKRVGSPGQFDPSVLQSGEGSISTSQNTPTITFDKSAGTVSYSAGNTFFAAAQMNPVAGTYLYKVVTRLWSTDSWSVQKTSCANYTWMAAQGEYLLTLDSAGGLSLQFIDGGLTWSEPVQTSLSSFAGFYQRVNDYAKVALIGGPSLAAISFNYGFGSVTLYQLVILQWDANHNFLPPTIPNQQRDEGMRLTWIPTITQNNLIAVNGNVWRFNGAAWIENSSLSLTNQNSLQSYAYGTDCALQIYTEGEISTAQVLSFDPVSDSLGQWSETPVRAALALPVHSAEYDNWPSARSEDYIVLGPYVYFRGSATNWSEAVQTRPLVNIAALVPANFTFNSESTINETPSFLAYSMSSALQSSTKEVGCLLLANGQLASSEPVTFASDQIYTSSDTTGSNSPGVSPEGPQIFVSFPQGAESFETATQISLHYYASSNVTGPLTHFPVTRIDIDDGFGQISSTCYSPDLSKAASDPTGQLIKYYETTTYRGTSDPTQPAYGRTVTRYLNGLGEVTGGDFSDMLDGLLSGTQTFDSAGNSLESAANTWSVWREVASDPTDPTKPLVLLRGGWVGKSQSVSVRNGVTTTKTRTFVGEGMTGSYTGRPVTVSFGSYNGNGTPETFVTTVRYQAEVNGACQALNLRSIPAQTIKTEALGTAAPQVIYASAAPLALWPSATGQGVRVPAKEASFVLLNAPGGEFPFSSYSAGTTPPGWLLQHRVTERTVRGQVSEHRDPHGIATSLLFSTDLSIPVAKVSNAPVGAAAYLGFEPYENTSKWTLTRTQPCSTDARTGQTSLQLPAGANASISVAVLPESKAQTYVVSIWYKTGAGWVPSSSAACAITIGGSSTTTMFGPTNDQWVLQTTGIPVTAEDAQAGLHLAINNATSLDLFLDSVYVTPLIGGLVAQSVHGGSRVVTSTADGAGHVRRHVYDRWARPALQLGPDGRPKELAQRFLSRAGNGNDLFDPASPNTELTLHPADGGSSETFRDGGEWQTRWAPSSSSVWQAADNALSNAGNQAATLTYKAPIYTNPLPLTFAVYFEVGNPSEVSPGVSVTAGPVSVSYSSGGYSAKFGSIVPPALASPASVAEHWVLVAGNGVVLFFADGQLLFSQTGSFHYGTPVITAGPRVSLRHLSFLASPRLSVSYYDGAKRQRQVQQLYGADSRVIQILRDSLSRRVATTRVAPGSFGSGAAQPVLQYRAGFVNAPEFLANVSVTGEMTGDIADYYAGQTVNGVARSNDEGYPYHGVRWEASSRKVKVETGRPGKLYAISNPSTTTPEQRNTLQLAYGANTGSIANLPAEQFNQTSVTTALKKVASRISDVRRRQVAVLQETNGVVVAQANGNRAYDSTASGPQVTLDVRLPNAILPGPQSGNGLYMKTVVEDSAKQGVSLAAPDEGAIAYIYDLCGRIRFVQPAMGAGEQWFHYSKYDVIGRVVELGVVPTAWNAAALSSYAEQPDWPSAGVSYNVTKSIIYDGDGTDATLIGKEVSCVTTTYSSSSQATANVTETFTYDSAGGRSSATMTLSGSTPAHGTIGYERNNLGELTRLTQPAGAPLAEVIYTHNDQGWVVAIGSSTTTPNDIAAYTYTAEGKIETQILGVGSWKSVNEYNSPGWLISASTVQTSNSQTLDLSYVYNLEGMPQARTLDYVFPGQSETVNDSYTYDEQGRLSAAQGSSNDAITSYDPNGNIWGAVANGAGSTFTLHAGNDRLATAAVGSPAASPVEFSARGAVTAAFDRSFTYDESTGLTASIEGSGTSVSLAYGEHRQRVLKQITGSEARKTVYFSGSSKVPQAQVTNGVWTSFVYGPAGLTAIYSDQAYFPLKDEQQSVWAVVSKAGLVASYQYSPWGALLKTAGAQADQFSIRFMGQEWDDEVSLANFRARLYDPMLRRFLSTDPAGQFPSAYVFCANNPLIMNDPSGELSLWAKIGIGAAMGAILAIGIGLTLFTGGGSDAVAVGLDADLGATLIGADLLTTEAAGDVATGGLAEVGAGAGEDAGGVAAGEGAAESGSEAGAGEVSEESSASIGSKIASAAKTIATNVASGILEGAGENGLQYDIQSGRHFTAAGFFESVGWGAGEGVIGGAIGGAASTDLVSGWTNPLIEGSLGGYAGWGKAGVSILVQGLAGGTASGLTQLLENAAYHQPATAGLLRSVVIGSAEGAAGGAISEGLGAVGRSSMLRTVGSSMSDTAGSVVSNILENAADSEALNSLAVGGFLIRGFNI